jgi:cyclomaltodextrinase
MTSFASLTQFCSRPLSLGLPHAPLRRGCSQVSILALLAGVSAACVTGNGVTMSPGSTADAGATPPSKVDAGSWLADGSSIPAVDSGPDGGSSPGTEGGLGPDAGPIWPLNLDSAAIYSVFTPMYSDAGTLDAVTADLPRIRNLGFDVLYLLPVTPVGQATSATSAVGAHPTYDSPYCVHDYYAIDAALGTEASLESLVQSAHALGMYVVLDEVLNHTAWDNALLTAHPEFYLHSDGNPQNVASIEHAFTYLDVAQLDYATTTNGTTNGLAAYMTSMLTHALTTYDVDGFRFDAADDPYGNGRMITAGFWQSLRPALEAVKPGVLMLGEELDPDLANAPFDLDYGWILQGLYGIDGAAANGLAQVASGGDAAALQTAWTAEKTGYPGAMRHMTLLQDWDLDEDLVLYGGAPNAMAAAAFAFTIDGVPLLFNGEEVGNDRSGVNTHTVVDWSGPNAASFTAFYTSLLALRNGSSALQQGAVTWIGNTSASQVVSYTRSDSTATFLVTLNFSNAPVSGTVSAPSASAWTDVSPTGSPGGTTHPLPPAFSLAPYDFAVFRAD